MTPVACLLLGILAATAISLWMFSDALRHAEDGYEADTGFVSGLMPHLVRMTHLSPGTLAHAAAASRPASTVSASVTSSSPFPTSTSISRSSSSPFVIHATEPSSDVLNQPAASPLFRRHRRANSNVPFAPQATPPPSAESAAPFAANTTSGHSTKS